LIKKFSDLVLYKYNDKSLVLEVNNLIKDENYTIYNDY
jgi:hypothetical protein